MKTKHPSLRNQIKKPLGATCAALLALTGAAPATLLLTTAGYTNDFAIAPVAGDWITSNSNIAGTDGTFTTAAGVDAFVITNNYNASGLTTALGASTTNPPSANVLARWNGSTTDTTLGLKLLQMRPLQGTAKGANVLLFKMQNNTGGLVPSIDVAYDFRNPGAGTEQVPGWLAYYSVTGNSNWIKIPAFSTATPGHLTANLDFGGAGWSNGALGYILWVDDNAAGADADEASYTMDNFVVTVPVPSLFAITGIVVAQRAVTLTWRSQPGHLYRVERSEGLVPWEPVAARYPTGGATGDSTAFTDPAPLSSRTKAFYRVVDLGTEDIKLHSITNARMSAGDVGYTLDGMQMVNSRLKLENSANFGPGGRYGKAIQITDGYGNSGDLTALNANPNISMFYFGIFDSGNPSLVPFTSVELDSLHDWSVRGGKLIIGAGAPVSPFQPVILNSRWGFDMTWVDTAIAPTPVIPTAAGLSSLLFDGPFGRVSLANEGGYSQGYFSTIPAGSVVLADNGQGQPTIYLDCNTLDLVVADGDIFTALGGVSPGDGISTPNDILWANAIAYMDALEDPPVITRDGNMLSTGDYPGYQWYNGGEAISGATGRTYTASSAGTYSVRVSMRCGCRNVASLNTVRLPF